MATQRYADSQTTTPQTMNLSRLQTEVSNGTYKFTRPLIILNCPTQDKYIVYASCPHCLKGVHLDHNGYFCSVHQWQRVPVYRFALRILLSDWIGSECLSTVVDETAAKVLGFNANSYVAMTSDEERCASLLVRKMCRMSRCLRGRYIGLIVDIHLFHCIHSTAVRERG